MRRQPQTARPDTVLFFAHGTGGKQNPWRHLSRDVKETRTNKKPPHPALPKWMRTQLIFHKRY